MAERKYERPLQIEGEVWKPVIDFEQYSVSNLGRVRSEPRLRMCGLIYQAIIMSPNKGNNICLRKNKRNHWFKLPQLIMRAFIGPPPEGKGLVRHLDDNPENNILENLAWGDHNDNMQDAIRNGHMGKGSPAAISSGLKLKGRKRTADTKEKISKTKRMYPERQFYGNLHDPITGRFVSEK